MIYYSMTVPGQLVSGTLIVNGVEHGVKCYTDDVKCVIEVCILSNYFLVVHASLNLFRGLYRGRIILRQI